MDPTENRDTEYLDQLADQLKIDKTPACRGAINRVVKKENIRRLRPDSPRRLKAGSAQFVLLSMSGWMLFH
jgi:hypothetical protein